MSSLFRRKPTELVKEPAPARAESGAESPAESTADSTTTESAPPQPRKGYTPSKKERGITTPKRPSSHVRRPGATPTARSGKPLTKEERRAAREERRRRRQEVSEGIRRGDERYLSGRDRGPERALARDVVDSRRTVGTWFFGGALVVLFGSSAAMPEPVRLVSNLLWGLLAVAVIVDCTLLGRKVKRLIRERHPDSTERMGSLYLYVAMRAITFRRMRIPAPQVAIGDAPR